MKPNGDIFKIKLPFLHQTLRTKGFARQWCELIAWYIHGGSVGVNVNNNIGHLSNKKWVKEAIPYPSFYLT
jgi:hypothetical protein